MWFCYTKISNILFYLPGQHLKQIFLIRSQSIKSPVLLFFSFATSVLTGLNQLIPLFVQTAAVPLELFYCSTFIFSKPLVQFSTKSLELPRSW